MNNCYFKNLILPENIKKNLILVKISYNYNLSLDILQIIIYNLNNKYENKYWNSIKLAHYLCLQEYPTIYESSKGGGNFLIDNLTIQNYKIKYREKGISFVEEFKQYKN